MSNPPLNSPGQVLPPPTGDPNRLLHGLWLALPVLGCGLLGGFGLMYVGLRARQRSWWIAGVVYFVASVATFVIFATGLHGDQVSPAASWAVELSILLWFTIIFHGIVVNAAWLRFWKAKGAPSPNPIKAFDRRVTVLVVWAGVLVCAPIGLFVALAMAAQGTDPSGTGNFEALGFLFMILLVPIGIGLLLAVTAYVLMLRRYNPWAQVPLAHRTP